jgi:hypothetical protein
MSAVEKFPILLSDAEEESSAVPPCFSHEGINVRPLRATGSLRVARPPPLPATRPATPGFCAYRNMAKA